MYDKTHYNKKINKSIIKLKKKKTFYILNVYDHQDPGGSMETENEVSAFRFE